MKDAARSPRQPPAETAFSNTSHYISWSKNGFGEACARSSSGKFSREETEIVRRAVEDYCAMKKISSDRLCSECEHKPELLGAWMEIAKRLPHRTLQSVYRHGIRQLHPFKRGLWTKEETEELVDLVRLLGKKWSAIQSKLNRSADSCHDKYREISPLFCKGRWNNSEMELLKRLIRENLKADPNADMKELRKMVDRKGIIIPWTTISKTMTKRSRLSCLSQWRKMTGRYIPPELNILLPGAPAAAASTNVFDNAPGAVAARLPDSARSAPTAAAKGAAARIETSQDVDYYLLSDILNSGATRDSEVDWNSFRNGVEEPKTRWDELLQEWEDEVDPDDDVLELPVYEIARLVLKHKKQVKRAS